MTALASSMARGHVSKLIDPADLSASQRDWLRRLSMFRHYRAPGGWRMHGDPKLCTLRVARGLLQLGLVRHHGTYLVLTGNGRATLAIMDERIRNGRAR